MRNGRPCPSEARSCWRPLNQYILISIDDLFTFDGQKLIRKELRLPPGKKPLVLSIDDLNYYEYMRGDGIARKLVLDQQGQVQTLMVTPTGETGPISLTRHPTRPRRRRRSKWSAGCRRRAGVSPPTAGDT
jgi:hypothetical protein